MRKAAEHIVKSAKETTRGEAQEAAVKWRDDVENAHKDRTILVWGKPDEHPHLQVKFHSPAILAAQWDQMDKAFCINGGDWAGPFVKPIMWAEIEEPK